MEVVSLFRKRINFLPLAIISIIIVLASFILFIDLRLKASILEIAKSKAQITGVELIHQVVSERITVSIDYEDIVFVHKDKEEKITLIQANTVILNQIMAKTIIETSDSFSKLSEETFEIPLGQITGSKLIAGYGPKIKVKMIPAPQVKVEVYNKFEEAGINQTRHAIYFQISSTINIAVPFLNDDVSVLATVPLAETIIIGDVPHTYVNFTGSSELLYPFIKE